MTEPTTPPSGASAPEPQPPELRLIPAPAPRRPALVQALRDAAALALDALDYAGDRVAEQLGREKRPPTR